jgi:transposase
MQSSIWTALEPNGEPCRTSFPAFSTVWSYFRAFRDDGTWKLLHDRLREAARSKQGREATPSAAIIDSQSVKTSQKGGGAATMVASA